MEQLWYVFDQHDCFSAGLKDVNQAAAEAKTLAADGFKGIHIAYMTKQEFDLYCKDGKFPFAK